MFNIPTFYQQNMDFTTVFGGDLLKGMEMIQEHWDRYATGNSSDMYEDDDEFFATWEYEVNAYNVVYSTMKPLFA